MEPQVTSTTLFSTVFIEALSVYRKALCTVCAQEINLRIGCRLVESSRLWLGPGFPLREPENGTASYNYSPLLYRLC